jgi:ABC-type dipeptide/oligopeptide/nickel transport system permease component
MFAYILRRLFWFIPVFFVVTALTFWTVRKLPGGPFDFAGEKELPEHVVRNIKRKYGLDKPIWQQYLTYLGDLARLDFGVSFKYRDREVSEVLGLKLIEILRAETEVPLYKADDGTLVVLDEGEPQVIEPGLSYEMRDGTQVKYGADGDQLVIERRKDALLRLPLRRATMLEDGLAVRTDEGLVTLKEGFAVTLADGTVVQRDGEIVTATKGGLEVRIGETRALALAAATASGDAEKLQPRGVGYGVGSDLYIRLAPASPDVLVSEAVMRMTLQPVLVARVAAGEVHMLEDGQRIMLAGGASVIRQGGMVTVTTSMPAAALLEQPTFDIPIERVLAVGDGRGNLIPLTSGARVDLPDGTVVTGQGDHVVATSADGSVRVEIAEGDEDNLLLRSGDTRSPLSDRAVQAGDLVVLADEGQVYVMRERLRVPLVRYLGVVEGEEFTVLTDGVEYNLPDGTTLEGEEDQVIASRNGEKLVLGWTEIGQLAVVQGRLTTELKEGQRVELDKLTYVTLDRDLVEMQRRLDLPIKYVLYPQDDGSWTVWAPGLEEGTEPLPLAEGDRVDLPGDMTVRWDGETIEGQIRRVNTEGKVGLPISAKLGLFAMSIAICLGIPLGIIAALKHNSPIDYGATLFAILGVSIPTMVLGPLLILLFVDKVDWLDLTWQGNFANYILPAFSLGTAYSASIARLTRASLLQVIREDYIRTARAKGLAGRTVIVRHALKNSLIPVVTVLGPMFAGIVTGSMVTEQIFAIPGMGKHFITSIGNRDYPVLMAVTIIYAVLIVLANLAVDITYGVLDPRIRYQ